MSLAARIVLAALLALASVAGWWRLTAYYEGRGYARALEDGRKVVEEQQARMHDLRRAAELRYTVAAEARDRYLVTTVREIHRETAHLDACPVGPAVRLLNDAAACARGDRSAACGPEQPVRNAS